jgi:hypothetical protein
MLGGEDVCFEDKFQDSTMQEGWHWVREEATGWALSMEAKALTIKTSPGGSS